MIGADITSLVATLSGSLALVALVASPLMCGRTRVLALQLAAGLCFATHYAALGVAAACVANLLGLVQTGIAIAAPGDRRLTRLGWALVPVLVATAVVFWAGPVSILSSLAMISIAVGRMQVDERRLRLLVLLGGAFWIGHDFLVGAWIALAADILCAGCGAVVLLRRFGTVAVGRPVLAPSV